jgi:hypothetical protein
MELREFMLDKEMCPVVIKWHDTKDLISEDTKATKCCIQYSQGFKNAEVASTIIPFVFLKCILGIMKI